MHVHAQVNSETDFATKTDQFRDMVSVVAAAALRAHANGVCCAQQSPFLLLRGIAGGHAEAGHTCAVQRMV